MRLEIRDATEDDLPFVKELAVESVLFSIPYGRDIENVAVAEAAREAITLLTRGEGRLILVAVDCDADQPVGYMILELGSPDCSVAVDRSFILDICVSAGYRGSPAARLLTREGASRSARAGLSFMEGEVSAHNRSALSLALRLGFRVESCQLVMACGPDGPMPMPGRPASERHYQLSREERRRNRKRREA